MKSIVPIFETFSIAIDESTNVRDTVKLAVLIRGLKIELLEIIPMYDTTTVVDIFDALMKVLIENN